jgi:glycosidase
VTFIDNHDQIGRSPRARFLHNDPFPRQAVLAIGYLLTNIGIPCLYYGTEQGFDGGGDHDKYIRECMFGGNWGAFNTTGCHFFNPQHTIYQAISSIAAIRRQEPALRYGRQYFREISGNGTDFGYPLDGRSTLAYSRILDSTEILVTMNLDMEPRSDFVTVDSSLSPTDKEMVNLLDARSKVKITEVSGRHIVHTDLQPHEIAIFKIIVP